MAGFDPTFSPSQFRRCGAVLPQGNLDSAAKTGCRRSGLRSSLTWLAPATTRKT
jgi:hypothetical protein